MSTARELFALYSLLDDPQATVQKAVRDRILALGEDAVHGLRELTSVHGNLHQDIVRELVNEIRRAAALRRLGREFDGPEEPIDLEEGAFIISKFGFPEINTAVYQRRLDDMAADIRVLAGGRAAPLDMFMKLRSYLFSDLGFIGNREDYYNPNNSYLNKVIDYRKGIPITLSVLMLVLGHRLGVKLHGIGMPMHFLVQYDDGSRMFFVDAFNSGIIITRDQCRLMLASSGVRLTPEMLTPVTVRDVIERMWRNLYLAYQQQGDEEEAARVGDILAFINPEFKVNNTLDEEPDDEEDEDF
ncbi:MAG: transglutaminase-like domain-containing protein [Bacteroidota bacterium]|jgi:regulator of sirC expression with transglutaminase-like and TPR domain|nr:transglutaminase-like domain-containing protein [Bacteroidota bacterium]